jgi:hypothetical protein
MRRRRHAHVFEAALLHAGHQPDQEQEHAVPHHPTIGGPHKTLLTCVICDLR